MQLPLHDSPLEPEAQRTHDRRRLLRAFNASLATVLVLAAVYSAQASFDVGAWTVVPHTS